MIRYGIIGVGAMGREHAENLRHINGAEVVAVSDPNADSIGRAREIIGDHVKVFADHRDLLGDTSLDAVIIATPNFTHVDILQDALSTDFAIFIEKPLCTTIEDCQKVIEQSKNRKGLVWMGLEYRYIPPVEELIKIVKEGGVGRVHQVAIREHREPFYPKVDNWNRLTQKTGGTLVEKCCHYFNLMDHITGETPVRVFASGAQRVNFLDEKYDGRPADMLDSAYVILEYPSGARAMLDLCMFVENTVDKEHISVVGDEGKVESLLPSLELRYGRRSDVGNFAHWDHRASETQRLDRRKVWNPDIKYQGFHYGASFIEHTRFHAAIATGSQEPDVSLEEGMRSVATGLAAQKSIAEGRAVEMHEVLPAGLLA